jgi:hypothetical protein
MAHSYEMMSSSQGGWLGHVAWMGEKRNACSVVVGKPGKKRQTTVKT